MNNRKTFYLHTNYDLVDFPSGKKKMITWENYLCCMVFNWIVMLQYSSKCLYLCLCIILLGLNLVESYPYETVQRDYDYVRLASITAGKFTDFH